MSTTPQVVEYRGNCHCGAFKFTYKAAELKQAFTCNCSICSKNGYLWAFPAKQEDFTVVKGDENTTLTSYYFGKRTMAHKFCPTCGTSVLGRTVDGRCGINIRALADVDFDSLPVLPSDGAATEPLYQVPEPVAVDNVPESATNVYHGSCQCGAVGYTLLSPDKITSAMDCNCSICSRDGALWTYPPTTAVTFKGLDSLVEYTFGLQTTYHGFCKVCGVAIRERFIAPSTDTALNVRTMNGFDLQGLELIKEDLKSLLPLYEV
ncbi:Mss4-like protein [Mycena galopus ATCC 62051]|nr:Mss4-like protein [Mycena galopus ATCC 62051]